MIQRSIYIFLQNSFEASSNYEKMASVLESQNIMNLEMIFKLYAVIVYGTRVERTDEYFTFIDFALNSDERDFCVYAIDECFTFFSEETKELLVECCQLINDLGDKILLGKIGFRLD